MSDHDAPSYDPRTTDAMNRLHAATLRHARAFNAEVWERSHGAIIAYLHIVQYTEAASVQMDRMLDTGSRSSEAFDRDEEAAGFALLDQSYSDLHFYITCWAMVGRFLEILSGRSHLPAIRAVFARHKATFDDYRVLRNYFEHLDQHIPSLPGGDVFQFPLDDGSTTWGWRSGFFTLRVGDREWDISTMSLRRLENIAAELKAAIMAEP